MPVIASSMTVIASPVTVPVPAMGRVTTAMKARGIAMSKSAAGITSSPACAKVTGRAKMSAATVEVTAGRRRLPATAEVTAAATAGMTATATATAVRLCQYGCRAYQQRPQNGRCQNKAPALGTHDCHLFETHTHQTYPIQRGSRSMVHITRT